MRDLVKSLSREIECQNDCVALKFDRRLGNGAAESSVKFYSDSTHRSHAFDQILSGMETSPIHR